MGDANHPYADLTAERLEALVPGAAATQVVLRFAPLPGFTPDALKKPLWAGPFGVLYQMYDRPWWLVTMLQQVLIGAGVSRGHHAYDLGLVLTLELDPAGKVTAAQRAYARHLNLFRMAAFTDEEIEAELSRRRTAKGALDRVNALYARLVCSQAELVAMQEPTARAMPAANIDVSAAAAANASEPAAAGNSAVPAITQAEIDATLVALEPVPEFKGPDLYSRGRTVWLVSTTEVDELIAEVFADLGVPRQYSCVEIEDWYRGTEHLYRVEARDLCDSTKAAVAESRMWPSLADLLNAACHRGMLRAGSYLVCC